MSEEKKTNQESKEPHIPDIQLTPKLTPKQTKLAKGYAEAIIDPSKYTSQKQLAIDSGYSSVSAESVASETLAKPHVKRAISEYLVASGLSEPELAKMLQTAINRGLNADTKATVSDALRGIEQAFRLHDSFPAERKRVESLSLQAKIDIDNTQDIKDSLQKLIDKVSRLEELEARKDEDVV